MGLTCDWQISMQTLSQRGKYLLESGQWSDCKFIVGQEPHEQILEGHKLFLAMASPVFEAMFYGCMAEKADPIPIRDVQPEAFKSLLEYIYTGQVELRSFELACELCYCAKKYMLPFLVKDCTRYLWSDLAPNKACRAYEFAKLFEEPVLMEKCLSIISSQTYAVMTDPSWDEAELATITTIFEMEKLQINTELQLFVALQRWGKAEARRKSVNPKDPKALRTVIEAALMKIRFLTMTPQEFADGPGRSGLLSESEAFNILMNISATHHRNDMPEGFSTSRISRKSVGWAPYSLSPLGNPVFSQPISWVPNEERPPRLPSLHGPNFGIEEEPESTDRAYPYNLENDLPRRDAQYVGPDAHFGHNRLHGGPNSGGIHEPVKFHCVRSIGQQTSIQNSAILECSVAFNVDTNVRILGVQVPTQIFSENRHMPRSSDGRYTEILYAHVLDSEGSRLSYTHFTTKVSLGTFVEIAFNRPIFIEKDKTYKVGVTFNTKGWYPIGDCARRLSCDRVFFAFGIGRRDDNIRDGLIRAISFTYA